MTFKILRTNFSGDPNLGLYGFATDKYCLLGFQPHIALHKKIESTLKVNIKHATISRTDFISIFAAGNSKGIVLTKLVEDYEVRRLKEHLDVNLEIIKSRETAIGNIVLCNDNGCLIAGDLRKYKKQIEDALDCEVEVGTIDSLNIVGSAAVASNKGCLCHREADEEEIKRIEELLKVKVDIGTVNYGTPFIKAGLIVNSNGYVVSEETTGAELGRIDEVFRNE